MPSELNLKFRTTNKVSVHFNGRDTEEFHFKSPITDEDKKDIRWYLETYAALYTADVDDQRAEKIVAKLQKWGQALFNAVFKTRAAYRLYEDFLEAQGHLLTISAKQPAILSLPWELLYDPETTFLCDHDPTISIRRRLGSADTALKPFAVQSKDRLRVLFVVSRPSDADFIDPRADAKAVLEAIDEEASGRFEVEFLRPPTLENLTKRLERRAKYRKFPPVDVIHFDGHGVFDAGAETPAHETKPMGELKKESSSGMGYLLFENDEGQKNLVDAGTLGNMLTQKKVGLIILSACQSAAMDGDEPMSSVAARLTHAGIPAVLAMMHSVLVATTKQLFATFYESLAYGAGIGESLDDARRHLYSHPERGERQRGQDRITLKLYDWFLPALYQAGEDTPLIDEDATSKPLPVKGGHNLRQYQKEFRKTELVGRSEQLWQIERAFVTQGTRRLTIFGFGGQGKTTLALEAGEWLYRTGMFQYVCFVPYAAFGGEDAISLAVSTLATALEKSLVNVEAANDALQTLPTLLILDNLEAIKPAPLQELLTAAKQWPEIGNCRALLTTRTSDFKHPDYPTEENLIHQALSLGGLAEDDALAYFQRLLKLPPPPQADLPKRSAALEIFKQAPFHPLSIGLAARQLKIRRPADLGTRLEKLIAQTPDNPLLASLNLSLDRLDEEARRWLPRLGIFQGGAIENELLNVTGFTEEQRQTLRPALETTGLIQPERLPGATAPYLKFYPTLAPALRTRLGAEEQTQLLARHRQRYFELSRYLYVEDRKNPVQARAIALRELPNLLYAVHGVLDADEEWAAKFVDNVNLFLNLFGLKRESKALSQGAEKAAGEKGSQRWFLALSNKGEQLYRAARYQEAEQVFTGMLSGLGEVASYERCITLNWLGRCFFLQGKAATAAKYYRQGWAAAEQLERPESVKQQMRALQMGLADVLRDIGDYDKAQTAYEAALAIAKEQDDGRSIGAAEGELGTLALRQGQLQEAEKRYREALAIFKQLQLNEPETEAVIHHQLGRVHQETKQRDAAEQAYRESARLSEDQGNLAGAAKAWNQLAQATEGAGKPEAAEAWHRKALKANRQLGNKKDVSRNLGNLADLLQNQPHRLPEARQLAEEALAIMQTLDPAAAEIWTIYNILAKIAEKQNDTAKASEYRRLSREAKAAFTGTRYELREYEPLIAALAAAVDDAEVRKQLEPILEVLAAGQGGANLAAAIRHIWDGERDEEVLCEPLDFEKAPIINAILRGIENPETLKELLEERAL